MCKVFVIANMAKVSKVQKTTEVVAKHLLSVERDGFGYAILGRSGHFGERTNRDSFESRFGRESLSVKAPIIDVTSNMFGTYSQPCGAGVFHGRTSTNHKTLINTHPIQLNGWSLIHNGVVNNHGPKYSKTTTNDTEDIVHYMSTHGIGAVEEHLSGYYAFAALDPKGRLHVAKDSTASLFVVNCSTLDSLIFCTSEDLLKSICKELKLKIGPVDRVKDNTYMIFDPSGELIEVSEINPKGYTHAESRYASKSLGRDLDAYSLSDRYEESVNIDDWYDYRDEIERVDDTYQIHDWNGRTISASDFLRLDDMSQRECTVFRPDGTLVEPISNRRAG